MMRVVVAAWVGSTNLGDELVFRGLCDQLSGLGASVTAVSLAPGATRAVHGVDAVGHHDLAGLVRAVRRADAVVFGGGGLVQDQTSAFNAPYHLSRVWAARAAGTPVGAIGVGVGPLVTRLGLAVTRASLAPVRTVTTRDDASAQLLRRLGVGPVVVAADLALSLPLPDVGPEDTLVVALRPWTGRRRALPVSMGGRHQETPEWFVEAMAAALDAAAGATGLAVRFVAFQADRDGPLHERVAERMRAPASTACPDVDSVLAEVARSRVVVAVRYHALVAAVLAGRPAVCLGYSPKVASLAADAGGGAVALPWSHQAVEQVPAAIERAAGRDDAMAEARGRLRERERANGAALERLFDSVRSPPSW
ncbi:MAG: polysaccharide pyruvyl transferase family protein [Acidimicrobiales bacterium]